MPDHLAMSETHLWEAVRDLALHHRMLVYHTYDSRRSAAGFPDLVLVGSHRILFRELKGTAGKVADAQATWLARLRGAGADADVWRPADWHSGTISEQITAANRPRPPSDGERELSAARVQLDRWRPVVQAAIAWFAVAGGDPADAAGRTPSAYGHAVAGLIAEIGQMVRKHPEEVVILG